MKVPRQTSLGLLAIFTYTQKITIQWSETSGVAELAQEIKCPSTCIPLKNWGELAN